MNYTKIVSLVVSALVVIVFVCDQVNCAGKKLPCNDNTIHEVDRIIAKINPIGNTNVEFPETLPQAMKNCKQLARPISTLDDLNKRCMKGMMKEVVGIVLYSVKKKRRSICKKNVTPEMRDIVDAGKCVNKGRIQIERCANKSLDRVLAMKNVNNDLKLPLVCCEINLAKKCMLGSLDKVNICTQKHQDILLGHFDGLSGGALKIACNDFQDGSEKCNKLKSIKLQVKPGTHRPKSLVLPIIQLFESMDRH